MSVYEEYRTSRTSWGIGALGSVIVEVELNDEAKTVGVGISIGGEAACFMVENHLSRFVEGQDPTNVELIWDQMYRSTLNYGRKGIAIQAISAVDLAIWDALGKLKGLPVYELLGGKVRLAANSDVRSVRSRLCNQSDTSHHPRPRKRCLATLRRAVLIWQRRWGFGEQSSRCLMDLRTGSGE